MMKILLAAINAKYIHSNPGVYSLKAYALQEFARINETSAGQSGRWKAPEIEIGEYTINNQPDDILADIYLRKPDIIGFSCYIWNIEAVLTLVRDLRKVLPDAKFWLGGPEVSYDADSILVREPEITGVMVGEGEAVFAALAAAYTMCPEKQPDLDAVSGIAWRKADGTIGINPVGPLLDMNQIPFSYQDLAEFEHRIIYYESSRGCPFSCSYCLSSIDKTVRFRDLELIKQELAFFLMHEVGQVKFVDRTFNCRKSHAMAVWRFIKEHDNGSTNFHFEIAADLLDQEELELIRSLRPGLIQLEIGVQSTNEKTLAGINRKTDLQRLGEAVKAINQGANVHQHLDLIVGLPEEDYSSFQRSFKDVYRMHPEQLQLGFLKVLKGSHLAEHVLEYGMKYHAAPPYEILSTNWLGYAEILKLKGVEAMVEIYYNSRQFTNTLALLETEFEDSYKMFEELAEYYRCHEQAGTSHSRLARYEYLYDWIAGQFPDRLDRYADRLMEDLYLRENLKRRPQFASDQGPYKSRIKALVPELRTLGTQIHVEVFRDGSVKRFDYRMRDPLTHNARMEYLGCV